MQSGSILASNKPVWDEPPGHFVPTSPALPPLTSSRRVDQGQRCTSSSKNQWTPLPVPLGCCNDANDRHLALHWSLLLRNPSAWPPLSPFCSSPPSFGLRHGGRISNRPPQLVPDPFFLPHVVHPVLFFTFVSVLLSVESHSLLPLTLYSSITSP